LKNSPANEIEKVFDEISLRIQNHQNSIHSKKPIIFIYKAFGAQCQSRYLTTDLKVIDQRDRIEALRKFKAVTFFGEKIFLSNKFGRQSTEWYWI